MPRRSSYRRDTVLAAALELVREKGMDALSARALAARLGCSVAPIFGLFSDMEEVRTEVIGRMKEIYSSYVAEGLRDAIPFKGVGKAYIRFAVEEPNFFRTLFMCDNGDFTMDDVLPSVDDNYQAIFQSIARSYRLTDADSRRLYLHMWIYTHGIAVLCVTGTCSFAQEEVEAMIGETCRSLVKEMKARQGDCYGSHPD